jgi:hypothetical protein
MGLGIRVMHKGQARRVLKDYANKISSASSRYKRKINWRIVCLSHAVCKRHGLKGHNIRQKIRKELWNGINNTHSHHHKHSEKQHIHHIYRSDKNNNTTLYFIILLSIILIGYVLYNGGIL